MKLRLILFLSLSLTLQMVMSQNQLPTVKRIYTANDGKIYINKALPLYFKVSDSPAQNSKKILLKSETTPEYANPMYFTTEGLNSVFSPSAVDTTTLKVLMPKQSVYYQFYVDGTPPVTTVKNNSTPYDKKDTLFFGLNVKLKLVTTDNVAGVEKVFYSIDGEEFKEYKDDLTFPKEKDYILKYYSVDYVGNVEDIKILKFTIDGTKPLTNLKISGDYIDNIISGNALIWLKSEDAFSGIAKTRYILDKDPEAVYTTPISAKNISEGEHTLTYKTVDNVFNEEDSKVYNFFVDKTAPIVIDEVLGDSFFANGKEYSSGRTKLKLTAIDNRAGVKDIFYTLNNVDYILYDKPFYLPNQTGNVSVRYYAVDKVNNKTVIDTKNKLLYNSFMDLSGPEMSYNYDGKFYKFNDTTYINNTTNIILKGADIESGLKNITYSLDLGEEINFANKINVSGDGTHTIDYFGFDNVNNSNQASFVFKVDQTGPEIYSTFSVNPISVKNINGNNLKVYPSQLIVYLSAFDKMVGVSQIYYSLNNQGEKAGTSFVTLFPKGENTLKIRAIDLLGNQTTSQIVFYIQ